MQNKLRKIILLLYLSINRQELKEIINNLTKPAKERVPKVIRKTGKYYDIQPMKKKSLNNTQSLLDENFYSETSTLHPTRQGKRVKDTPYESVSTKHSKSRNNNRTINIDMNTADEVIIKPHLRNPIYLRTREMSFSDKNTPMKPLTHPYKSKLWRMKEINSNLSTKYRNNWSASNLDMMYQKAADLENRVMFKEMRINNRSNSIAPREAKEMGDMLIDSILYKVTLLKKA